MIIVITDFELEDYICTNILDGRTMDPLSKKDFKKWLSFLDAEIYFVDVNDKTWEKFRTENSKRLELTLDELNELLDKASYFFVIKKSRVESCIND